MLPHAWATCICEFFSTNFFKTVIWKILSAIRYKNERRQVNKNSYAFLKNGAYKDGVKRKGDKIGMGDVAHTIFIS